MDYNQHINSIYLLPGYIPDLSKFTEQIKSTNIWTEQEKATFKDLFHKFPKNFEQISSSLKNKVRLVNE